MRVATKKGGGMLFSLDDLLTSRQIAGVYTGFKKTSITARKKADAKKNKKKKLNEDEEEDEEMEEEEEVVDEVNDLFNTEGDEELEYETEPLFDQDEIMRRAVMDQYDELFTDNEEELAEHEHPTAHKKRPHHLMHYYFM